MKIFSFNVNGVRARPHQLKELVETHQPDVIGLQEIKAADDAFPAQAMVDLGYHAEWHGQKGHYGVALLSKQAPLRVAKGFPGEAEDAQRRSIYGVYQAENGAEVTVFNGYFPQGENRKHETKYPNKQAYYQNLSALLEEHMRADQPLVVMGDFNIASLDTDIGIGPANAKRWLRDGKCSFLPEEREWYQRLLDWGLVDTFRRLHPEVEDRFSWFDYRSRGFEAEPKRGLRIDMILATSVLAEACVEADIDYHIRGMEKPSDHCPIWADFKLN